MEETVKDTRNSSSNSMQAEVTTAQDDRRGEEWAGVGSMEGTPITEEAVSLTTILTISDRMDEGEETTPFSFSH